MPLTGLGPSIIFAENTVNAAPQLLDADVTFTFTSSLTGGRLVVSGLLAEDRVSVLDQGGAEGQIGVSGADISFGGTVFGTLTGGAGNDAVITFNASATAAGVDALIQRLAYRNVSDTPTLTRTLTVNVVDGSGAGLGGIGTLAALSGTASPFNGITGGATGNYSAPAFLDLDGDGDLDLVSGDFGGSVLAFRNIGSASAPSFSANPLSGSANPFNGIDVGDYAKPAFLDLDGDGDLDLVSGNRAGNLLAFRNIGTASAPSFSATPLSGSANPFNGLDAGFNSTPAFLDLDGDGDLDLVSGSDIGPLLAWRNTGTASAPSFSPTPLSDSANPFDGINVGNYTNPAFVDLDGDGDRDLVVGSGIGNFVPFRNTGSASVPAFTALSGTADPFNGIFIGANSTPAFVDLDRDGDLDLVSGEFNGPLFAFRNTPPLPGITVNVTPEAEGPAAPSAPDLDAASDTGASPLDNITKDNTPSFSGTATAGLTVTLYDSDGTTALGSTTSAGDGKWSITAATLDDGDHSITAVASNGEGTSSVPSASLTVTIDTKAPAAPGEPDLSAKFDSGRSATDNITSVTNPFFTGTALENGSTITLFDSDGTTILGTTTVTNGTWSIGSSKLAEGDHTVTARATDAAGNVSAASTALVVTIDTEAPDQPAAPTLDAASDTGISNSDGITNDTTPTFTGTTEGLAFVQLFDTDGKTVLGTTTADGTGAWSITSTTLSAVDHSITTKVTDVAGNVSSASPVTAVTVDNTAPAVSGRINISDTALKIGDTANVQFTFTEKVAGFTTDDVLVENAKLGGLATADGGLTWTAVLTPSSGVTDSANILTVDLTGLTDLAGNAGVGTKVSGNYGVDTERPSLASAIAISDTALKIGDTATVTFTFTEAVTGFTAADIVVPNGKLANLMTGDGGIIFTATLTPNGSTTAASNVLTLDLTGVNDLNGNAGSGTADSGNYAVDTVRPTLGIKLSDTALSIGEAATVTFTFSEQVTGFDLADVTVANGKLTAPQSSDLGLTYTATFTPDDGFSGTGQIISVGLTGVADLAGNAGSGSTDSATYVVDTQRPTLQSFTIDDTALKIGDTAKIGIQFSEKVTDFTTDDLTAENGVVSNLASSDGGLNWTATLTPNAGVTDASNLVSLDLTTLTDLAGNGGTGSKSSDSYAIDTVRPDLAASITLGRTPVGQGKTSSVTFTFTEKVTDFTTADLTVSKGEVTELGTADEGLTWVGTFAPDTGATGQARIELNEAGVFDLAGNAGMGSSSVDVPLNSPPTGDVTIAFSAPGSLTAANTLADADGLGVITYQWQRLVGEIWTDIDAATGVSFTPGAELAGQELRADGRYTDAGGTAERVASTITAFFGTATADRLAGSATSNILAGLAGDDTLTGGAGDSLYGGAGNDRYVVDNAGTQVTESAGAGIDQIDAAIDWTLGSNLENLFYTGTGDFTGIGNSLANRIWGGDGNDLLRGGAGRDSLYGGAGDDTIEGGGDSNLLNGGDGFDLVSYAGVSQGVSVFLTSNTTLAGGRVLDTITGFEGAIGGNGDDSFGGTSGANRFEGGNGADTLRGAAGDDTLDGGAGDDQLIGGLGADVLKGGAGMDFFVFTAADFERGLYDVVTDIHAGGTLDWFAITGVERTGFLTVEYQGGVVVTLPEIGFGLDGGGIYIENATLDDFWGRLFIY